MPKCPECGEEFAKLAAPIVVTEDHRTTIDAAIGIIRKTQEDENISEGRALELISADFLAGSKEWLKEDS